MARVYQVPPSTAEKEKAVGGVLTFAQFGWLIVGLVICLIVFAITYVFTNDKIIGIVFGAPFLLVGVPFAFYRKYEMSFFKYLKLNRIFKSKTKQLINKH